MFSTLISNGAYWRNGIRGLLGDRYGLSLPKLNVSILRPNGSKLNRSRLRPRPRQHHSLELPLLVFRYPLARAICVVLSIKITDVSAL